MHLWNILLGSFYSWIFLNHVFIKKVQFFTIPALNFYKVFKTAATNLYKQQQCHQPQTFFILERDQMLLFSQIYHQATTLKVVFTTQIFYDNCNGIIAVGLESVTCQGRAHVEVFLYSPLIPNNTLYITAHIITIIQDGEPAGFFEKGFPLPRDKNTGVLYLPWEVFKDTQENDDAIFISLVIVMKMFSASKKASRFMMTMNQHQIIYLKAWFLSCTTSIQVKNGDEMALTNEPSQLCPLTSLMCKSLILSLQIPWNFFLTFPCHLCVCCLHGKYFDCHPRSMSCMMYKRIASSITQTVAAYGHMHRVEAMGLLEFMLSN